MDILYPVVFASDNNGVEPLGVAMHSLICQASTTRYDIHVLSHDISAVNKQRLQRVIAAPGSRHQLRFVEIPESLLGDLPATSAWPVTAWARVFIPDLLPEIHGIALYLDIDILVCQDLGELFATSLHGKAAGAVLEHVSRPGSHFNARLDMPLDSPGYFNSGVLLIDVTQFRMRGLTQRILDYAVSQRQHLICPDQDALNGVLCRDVQPLHHKWNWHDGLTRQLLRHGQRSTRVRGAPLAVAVEAALRPGILHYQGANKPWRYNHRIEGPRYAAAMTASGFGRLPLEGRTPAKVLKRALYVPLFLLTWWHIRRLRQKLSILPASSEISTADAP